MPEIDKTLWYLFVLSFLLIAVAYFTGLSTDVKALGGVANTLGNTFTGRNASGQFAAYPKGG